MGGHRLGGERLERGGVPVLGGYIGSTEQGIVTTLGRGGSDTSAVALAAAYQAAFEAALPIILAGATAANTLAPLSVTPVQIAEFTARVLALPVAGKSQTLKASPT